MKIRRRIFLIFVAIGIGACNKEDQPVDPVWGKEPCKHCRMLVQDRLHAAQAVHQGERYFFDDVGCMVLWNRKRTGTRIWVRDGAGSGWLSAEQARYRSGATTPMDFGFEARSDGGPLGWEDIRRQTIAKEEGR